MNWLAEFLGARKLSLSLKRRLDEADLEGFQYLGCLGVVVVWLGWWTGPIRHDTTNFRL